MNRSLPARTLLVGSALILWLVAGAVGMASATHILTPAVCDPASGTLADGTTVNSINANAGPTKLRTKGEVRILQTCNVGNGTATPPAFTSGWHTHPGPVLINVTEGTLTFYGPDCTATPVSHGQAYLETPGQPLVAKNEGTGTAKWITTLIIPVGVPARTDVDPLCGI